MKKHKKQEAPEPEIVTEAQEDQTVEELEAEAVVDPLTKLQNEIEAARTEASNNWDLYLRERADLENARKRHLRDKEEALRFANDRLLKEMIPVLDNLERAVSHAEQSDDSNQGLLEGVNMTINQFRKALEDFGVKPINAVGEPFDPNMHQAMGQVESAEQAPNTVVTEFQRGYLLHNRLLRPSLVMVAKAPTNNAADADRDESTTTGE
ncbi:MAG: nucleotide exchange factor GrpE [Desulfuromonadales bacterium]|nr:nucleotide exchange factor GrpE [Desulfuromonadales bacterium]